MTLDVLALLRDELARRTDPATGHAWQEALRPIVEQALEKGWLAQPGAATLRAAERSSVHAEEALFCAWRWLTPSQVESGANRWTFPLGESRRNLADLLARLAAVNGPVFFVEHAEFRYFGFGVVPNSPLLVSLTGADLTGADLTGANLRART